MPARRNCEAGAAGSGLNTPTLGGGVRLAPEAELDDGLLEVVMIEMLQKREVLALIPRLLISGD